MYSLSLTFSSSASARRPGDELHYGPSHLTNSLKWPEERLYQQSIRRAVLEGSMEEEQYRREQYDSYESPPEQETQEDENHTQMQADQTPTPKSGSEGSGSDAMDVEKREEQDD